MNTQPVLHSEYPVSQASDGPPASPAPPAEGASPPSPASLSPALPPLAPAMPPAFALTSPALPPSPVSLPPPPALPLPFAELPPAGHKRLSSQEWNGDVHPTNCDATATTTTQPLRFMLPSP